MIKHVVCFKLKDNSIENCKETKIILLSMKDYVPLIKDISVGIDFLRSPRSYDIILEVILEDKEALELYQKDPYHDGVVRKHMHSVSETSISLDFEI